MKKDNLESVIQTFIDNLNWDFIIGCYGTEENKLKCVFETSIQQNNKIVKTFMYVVPTIDMLKEELSSIIVTVIKNKHKHFCYGHWTIRQTNINSYGDSLEVSFTPTRFTVIDDTNKVKSSSTKKDNLMTLFVNRKTRNAEFIKKLKTENKESDLNKILSICIDDKNQDFETAVIIRNRIIELNNNNNNNNNNNV